MPKIPYIHKRFLAKTLAVIEQADDIISAYQAQGLSLTLRQLYYRFVATGLIPNKQSEYKRLGEIINDGRMAGYLDWSAIEDRGRSLNEISTWANPGDIIDSCARSYAIDLWEGQVNRVEVWVEKQALEAVIEKAAGEFAVESFACKGYVSQSAMWAAAQRMLRYEMLGQHPVIIHLGDHDPSGIDMTRDIRNRLRTFEATVTVDRIALNMDQIRAYSPPPNPAKMTDSRAGDYVVKYGAQSWELDALEPATLHELIQDKIKSLMDVSAYEARVDQQEEERGLLVEASSRWEDVREILEDE